MSVNTRNVIVRAIMRATTHCATHFAKLTRDSGGGVERHTTAA
jgi:hypothetical protein